MNNSHSLGITLDRLIAREKLRLHSVVADTDAVFAQLLPGGGRTVIDRPLLIGIDGPVTAGKSFLADALSGYLTRHNIGHAVIHGDWCMASRATRKKEIDKAMSKSYAIADYDAAACDFKELARIQQCVYNFLFLGRGPDTVTIRNAYNRLTGKTDQTVKVGLRGSRAVIFEGTGLLNAAMREAFDISVRVDVRTVAETMRRLVIREARKEQARRLPASFVEQRYRHIDYRYDRYLRSRDSRYFDVLLDTSDPAAMRLYKRSADAHTRMYP